MDARIIEGGIGSTYAADCACGREVRVSGPTHIQPTQVTCGCGAVYQFSDPGQVTILTPPVVAKVKAKSKPEPVVEPEPATAKAPIFKPTKVKK